MNKLDQEESEILKAFESGKIKRAKDSSDIQKRHQLYAEAMFKKDARINIRLPSKDLRGFEDCRKKPLLKVFLTKRWLPVSFTNM